MYETTDNVNTIIIICILIIMAERSEAFVLRKTGGRQHSSAPYAEAYLPHKVSTQYYWDWVGQHLENGVPETLTPILATSVRSSDMLEGRCCFKVSSIIFLTLKLIKQTQNEKKRGPRWCPLALQTQTCHLKQSNKYRICN